MTTTAVGRKSVTHRVADLVVDTRYRDLPAEATRMVKNTTLDTLAAITAGTASSTGKVITGYVRGLVGNPEATVIGGGFKTNGPQAALANGTMGHALELDDYSRTVLSHPANPLLSAILAIGETTRATGEELILAFVLGWEVTAQTSKAVRHAILERGWHNQGFQPALGAAAAGSKLLGFDQRRTRMALGLAASMCAGFHVNRGSDTKPFHAGNAARSGVMAAQLVSQGFTANEDILDGPLGFCRILGEEGGDAEKVLDGLGSWDLVRVGSSLKPHASCGGGHYAMDAVGEILRRQPISPEEIEVVDCYVPPGTIHVLPYHEPQTGLEGKFSLEYGITAMVLDGRAGVKQFSDAAVRRPEAQAFMKRVRYHFPPGIPDGVLQIHEYPHRAAISLKDGRRFEAEVRYARGQLQNPQTPEEIAEKFHDCADVLLSADQRAAVIAKVQALDTLADVNELTGLLIGGSSWPAHAPARAAAAGAENTKGEPA